VLALASVTVGLVLLELSYRALLFADWTRDWAIARHLRRPELYADSRGRDYWKLFTLFRRPGYHRNRMPRNERLGWLKEKIDPETFAHQDEATLGGRRPVLLFGDSYGGCVRRAERCWEELLEASELSGRYALLNYSGGGYGFDQICLLMQAVLPRFAGRDPVVVVGILVDDDLDRSYLPIRIRSKPYFELDDGRLVLHLASEGDPMRFVEEHPVGIVSYAWRWLLFGSGLFARDRAMAWTGERDHVAVKKAINARLLADTQAELERLGFEHFFLLFHGEGAAKNGGPLDWQEVFLYEELARHGISFVSSKRYLRAHLRATGAPASSLFFQDEPGKGHYTDEANALVFEAFRDGLAGRFESGVYLAER
jgi:hypothetical protein